jgi:hypothetical protein
VTRRQYGVGVGVGSSGTASRRTDSVCSWLQQTNARLPAPIRLTSVNNAPS